MRKGYMGSCGRFTKYRVVNSVVSTIRLFCETLDDLAVRDLKQCSFHSFTIFWLEYNARFFMLIDYKDWLIIIID